jgi:RsiW-degrading membrane proteinase PrsW (M82 family)
MGRWPWERSKLRLRDILTRVASITCACGQVLESPGLTRCPACGREIGVPQEKIRFLCACGAKLSAGVAFVGKAISCPRCELKMEVPSRSDERATSVQGATGNRVPGAAPAGMPEHPRAGSIQRGTSTRPAVRRSAPAPEDPCWMVWTRYALVLTLLPLLVSILMPKDNIVARIQEMVRKDPALAKVFMSADKEDVFASLPGERIEGAAFGRHTFIHWLMALLSALAFWLFILIAWPMGRATSKQLWFLGIFTGTIGIFLLLAVQWIALHLGGPIIPRSIIGVFIVILQFIGFSYRAALNPENGFLLSMLGFTFGVGFCEEACKSMPLIFMARRKETLDARGLALLGLATGIGFGVSEGITYARDHYNGVLGGWVYVVRFVSCVALHAVWSSSSALVLWRSQADVEAIERWYDWFLPLLKIVGISMIFHGLYDTCLKRDLDLVAFVAGAASFAWFLWLYQWTIRQERCYATSLETA